MTENPKQTNKHPLKLEETETRDTDNCMLTLDNCQLTLDVPGVNRIKMCAVATIFKYYTYHPLCLQIHFITLLVFLAWTQEAVPYYIAWESANAA